MEKSMKIVKLSIFCTAFGLFVFACTSDVRPIVNKDLIAANQHAANVNRSANLQPTAPADVLAEARKIYADKCVKCHKEDGTGGKVTIEDKTINADNFT